MVFPPCLCMIFSENRFPLFRIMLYPLEVSGRWMSGRAATGGLAV